MHKVTISDIFFISHKVVKQSAMLYVNLNTKYLLYTNGLIVRKK